MQQTNRSGPHVGVCRVGRLTGAHWLRERLLCVPAALQVRFILRFQSAAETAGPVFAKSERRKQRRQEERSLSPE
jgi:hypothetical protein